MRFILVIFLLWLAAGTLLLAFNPGLIDQTTTIAMPNNTTFVVSLAVALLLAGTVAMVLALVAAWTADMIHMSARYRLATDIANAEKALRAQSNESIDRHNQAINRLAERVETLQHDVQEMAARQAETLRQVEASREAARREPIVPQEPREPFRPLPADRPLPPANDAPVRASGG